MQIRSIGIDLGKTTFHRAVQLYEHERRAPQARSPFGSYVQRWAAWVAAGLAPVSVAGAGRGHRTQTRWRYPQAAQPTPWGHWSG